MSDKTTFHSPETAYKQGLASNPAHSAWVSANAGSGKTTVLTKRVLRLLLNGCQPSKILSLTYTKTAAGEMSNRVFSELGKWTTLSDDALRQELETLDGAPPSAEKLKRARTLFAASLDTPGGLKIQTIHAFCTALLRQFPLEANVPGSFSVADEEEQKRLIELARRDVVLQADRQPDSLLGSAFQSLIVNIKDKAQEDALKNMIDDRRSLIQWLRQNEPIEMAAIQLRKQFGFDESATVNGLYQDFFQQPLLGGLSLTEVIEICNGSDSETASKIAAALSAFSNSSDGEEKFELIAPLVLTQTGLPKADSKLVTKDLASKLPRLKAALIDLQEKVLALRYRCNTLISIDHTAHLLVFSQAIVSRYEQLKNQRGILDYDDQIEKTAHLLNQKSASQWVLYKLDRGIDHILLDESQDTSPLQWTIIDALADDFFAGDSASTTSRTLFAVGDEKQSIYSFQGAEPRSFDRQRRKYESKSSSANQELRSVQLALSFRSTPDVLGAVDQVFSNRQILEGVTYDGNPSPHEAARRNEPGTVEVWSPHLAGELTIPDDWHSPSDSMDEASNAQKLASDIADEIALYVEGRKRLANGKTINAGDIMVLVRSRDPFVPSLNRALKQRAIPVAGADKLNLTDHIATLDLMAAGNFVLNVHDDLSLACVLKSPLINLCEDDLFVISQNRFKSGFEISLFRSLQELVDNPVYRRASEKLELWLRRADTMPVFEFYARLLGADGGRKEFYRHLGLEVDEILNAFLDLTLKHEQTGLPGLQAFLEGLRSSSPIVKREMESRANQVRVMTVHAAKGLEAPLVFLVDGFKQIFRPQMARNLHFWEENGAGRVLWIPESKLHGDVSNQRRKTQRTSTEEEYRRLLYVGMTRARDALIVCGYKGKRPPSEATWHTMVCNGLENRWREIDPDPAKTSDDGQDLKRYIWEIETGRSPLNKLPTAIDEAASVPTGTEPAQMPGWVHHKLPAEPELPKPLTPSGAGALIDETLCRDRHVPSMLIKGDDDEPNLALLRGTVVHKLLQRLPDMDPDEWQTAAERYLRHHLPDISEAYCVQLFQSVKAVLTGETNQQYFDPQTSRAEVPVMGVVNCAGTDRSVSGVIHRLVVLPDGVVLIDYKTNCLVRADTNDVPPDYVMQMALYRSVIGRIFPTRKIETLLVWTMASPQPCFMELPERDLDAAMATLAQTNGASAAIPA